MTEVLIDARRMQDDPPGGVGRSLARVIEAMAGLPEAEGVRLSLLIDGRRPAPPSSLLSPQPPALRAAVPVPGLPELVWVQWSIRRPLRRGGRVFHGTFNQLPVRRPRAPRRDVVTIHDLSWELHPEGQSRAKRRAFQAQARIAARQAAEILVPTEFTKGQLVECYDVDPALVTVTPWAVDARFGPHQREHLDELRRHLGLGDRYAVALGGAARRGAEVAIEAWAQVAGRVDLPQLVVVGGSYEDRPGLVQPGHLDDRWWPVLLAGAACFLYPTRYEGFGMPALEAAASGAPVVCAPVASLPEVLGSAALWCAEPSVAAFVEGLEATAADPGSLASLRQRGLERAAVGPTWADAAAATLAAYRRAAG